MPIVSWTRIEAFSFIGQEMGMACTNEGAGALPYAPSAILAKMRLLGPLLQCGRLLFAASLTAMLTVWSWHGFITPSGRCLLKARQPWCSHCTLNDSGKQNVK